MKIWAIYILELFEPLTFEPITAASISAGMGGAHLSMISFIFWIKSIFMVLNQKNYLRNQVFDPLRDMEGL